MSDRQRNDGEGAAIGFLILAALVVTVVVAIVYVVFIIAAVVLAVASVVGMFGATRNYITAFAEKMSFVPAVKSASIYHTVLAAASAASYAGIVAVLVLNPGFFSRPSYAGGWLQQTRKTYTAPQPAPQNPKPEPVPPSADNTDIAPREVPPRSTSPSESGRNTQPDIWEEIVPGAQTPSGSSTGTTHQKPEFPLREADEERIQGVGTGVRNGAILIAGLDGYGASPHEIRLTGVPFDDDDDLALLLLGIVQGNRLTCSRTTPVASWDCTLTDTGKDVAQLFRERRLRRGNRSGQDGPGPDGALGPDFGEEPSFRSRNPEDADMRSSPKPARSDHGGRRKRKDTIDDFPKTD